MQSILIVDDLESIHEMLDAVIQPIGYHTAFATNGQIALEKLRKEPFDIVLTDINMKPMDGLALLAQIKEINPKTIVIMMSGYANVQNATQALKLGAFDFLTKPFKVDQLMSSINRASQERKKRLEAKNGDGAEAANILAGDSDLVKKLSDQIARFVKIQTPLLITGENGTQKSSIAVMLHARSELAEGPFVTIDFKNLSPEEAYKALFDEDGEPSAEVQSARGGALFLGHIDQVPVQHQSAVGTLIKNLKSEIRVISSSSQDLEKLMDAGQFEDALYFRIASSVLRIPSLRDRAEDIPSMALAYFNKNGYNGLAIGERASALLQAYRWPGNYTEFEEALATAAATTQDGVISETDLPEKLQDTSNWPSLSQFLEEQSERYRRQVLNACQGDAQKAAQILGCDPSEV